MSINLLKHVWNKVYFNVDLPTDRRTICNLKIKDAFIEFILPTTKPKTNVQRWLGSSSAATISVPKAIFLVLVDILFFIPRLALNILKLVTEVLTLTLRELAYAGFNKMIKRADESPQLPSVLYKLAAGFCWVGTSLLSLFYFVGCLITSPGFTIFAINDTFTELGKPALAVMLSAITGLTVLAFHVVVFLLILPFTLPALGLSFVTASPQLIYLVASPVIWPDLVSQFIFNTQPNTDALTPFSLDDMKFIIQYPETNLSIKPSEFMKIFSEKSVSVEESLQEKEIKTGPKSNGSFEMDSRPAENDNDP